MTHSPLATLVADPDLAVLERDERRRQQDRVRLAGDARSGSASGRGAGGRRRASAAASVRFATALRPSSRSTLELGERPERQLLQAERHRARPARSARPSRGAGAAAPAATCGRGRRSSSGSARAPAHGTSLRTPCASSSPTPLPSRRRTTTRSPLRWPSRGAGGRARDLALSASGQVAGSGRLPAARSSSTRSRRASSVARGCACR